MIIRKKKFPSLWYHTPIFTTKWLFGTFVGSRMVSMDNKEKDSPQFSLSISMSDGKDRWFFIICKFHLFAYNRDIEFKQFQISRFLLSNHIWYYLVIEFIFFKLNNNRSNKDDPNTTNSSHTLPPLDDGIEKLKYELLVSYCVVS